LVITATVVEHGGDVVKQASRLKVTLGGETRGL
jgi:hypothetical protein